MSVTRALVLVLACWTALTATRALTSGERGLRAQYFRTANWQGTPAVRTTDATFSARQLSRRWRFAPPEPFSAQWLGYLYVSRPGNYRFTLSADDHARLYIDQRLVALNGEDGRIELAAGSHAVTLQYVQLGGAYRLDWLWARDDEALVSVPGWRLTPASRLPASLAVLRALEWLWQLMTGLALGLAGLLLWRRVTSGSAPDPEQTLSPHAPARSPAASWTPMILAASLALFAVLAVLHTWPLATNPAGLSRNDNADTMLNEWTVAWIAHQLPRSPLRLADANIFHPDRDALAYSEMLLVQGLMGAPLIWLGASPVLTYNLLLIAGFTLTGWTMSLVMAKWTGDWLAGLTAGCLLAFNSHTLTRLPHLQAQHVEFLPLTLFALDALLRRPRWQAALWLALWFTLQALTSTYLLVLTAVALVAAVAVRPEDWMGPRFTRALATLALAAALAFVAVLPPLLPYWRLNAQGLERSLDEVAWFSASARDYFTGASHIHQWLGVASGGETALFPGVLALGLAGLAIARGEAFTDRRARMCLALGLAGVYLSFGPLAPGYERLYDLFPLLHGIRASARFGYLGIVAVAALAAYGMAALRAHQRGARSGRLQAAFGAVFLLAAAEPLAAPLGYQPFTGIPAIYDYPRTITGAVVVELPFPPPPAVSRNGRYVLNSTRHWKPLLNGYSGFIPTSYYGHYEALRTFPSEDALRALVQRGVTHVFVHLDQFTAGEQAALDGASALTRVDQEGSIVLYEVE